MKNCIPFTIIIFLSPFALVAQDVEVTGNLEATGTLNGSGLLISGNTPGRITTTATSVLDLRGANPLIEIRDNTPSATYLAFIQMFGNDLYLANRQAGNLHFRTSNLNRMIIDAGGNVGIGLITPNSKLTINGPENDGTAAGLEIRSGSQTIIIDGNEMDCLNSDLHFNNNSLNDILMRTTDRKAEFTLAHGNGSGAANGVSFSHPGANDEYWTWYSTNGDGFLELYHQGILRGEFNPSTGAYSAVSDRSLKADIQPFSGVLEDVMNLEPASYRMKDDPVQDRHLGFIAQEVAEIFPELVSHGTVGDTDEQLYLMDYAGFGVVSIAALQEFVEQQTAENNTLRQDNLALRDQLLILSERLEKIEARLDEQAR